MADASTSSLELMTSSKGNGCMMPRPRDDSGIAGRLGRLELMSGGVYSILENTKNNELGRNVTLTRNLSSRQSREQ